MNPYIPPHHQGMFLHPSNNNNNNQIRPPPPPPPSLSPHQQWQMNVPHHYFPPPAPPPPPPPPVYLPRLEPHLALWKLAEDYFSAAQKLPAKAVRIQNHQLIQQYQSLVLCGIKCLRAVLQMENAKLSITVEMQTRLRLAEVLISESDNLDMAEDLLSKGILRIPKIAEFYDIKFAMQQLQATILAKTSPKACRAHLKTCLDEATDRELLIWQYSFLLLRLHQISPSPDIHEITQYNNTLTSLRTLAHQNSDFQLEELSYLLEIRHTLLHNLNTANIEQLLSLAQETSARSQPEHLQLSLMRMLLHILYLTKVGNGLAAATKLREHHQLMDTTFTIDKNQWRSTGKFEISVCAGQHRLVFDWFTEAESFVFGYILSGIVNLPDSSGPKAGNFLSEGTRVVESMMNSDMYDCEGWLGEITARRELLLRLKRYALLYGSFAALLRSSIHDTNTRLQTLKAQITTSPPDPTFSNLLRLLEGTYHQFCGHIDQALEAYSHIPFQAGDIYILSLLNSTFILRIGTPQQQARAKRFCDEIERCFALRQPSPQLFAAYNLVKGITSTEIITSQFAPNSPPLILCLMGVSGSLDRAAQMASDQTNRQLTMLALGVKTSRYYINTSTEQAERAALMVYVAAKKAKDELWQLISGNVLADVFGRQDKQVKKGKQVILNNEHRQQVQARLNTGSQ